jgi:hypothetical protein
MVRVEHRFPWDEFEIGKQSVRKRSQNLKCFIPQGETRQRRPLAANVLRGLNFCSGSDRGIVIHFSFQQVSVIRTRHGRFLLLLRNLKLQIIVIDFCLKLEDIEGPPIIQSLLSLLSLLSWIGTHLRIHIEVNERIESSLQL